MRSGTWPEVIASHTASLTPPLSGSSRQSTPASPIASHTASLTPPCQEVRDSQPLPHPSPCTGSLDEQVGPQLDMGTNL